MLQVADPIVREGLGDPFRVIGRGVVHDDDLEVLKGLTKDAGDRGAHQVRPIVRRYDDADSWIQERLVPLPSPCEKAARVSWIPARKSNTGEYDRSVLA